MNNIETDWASVARLADTVPVETAAGALARIEAALTDENDCSIFDLVIAGGADPVRVRVTPDALRTTLTALHVIY